MITNKSRENGEVLATSMCFLTAFLDCHFEGETMKPLYCTNSSLSGPFYNSHPVFF